MSIIFRWRGGLQQEAQTVTKKVPREHIGSIFSAWLGDSRNPQLAFHRAIIDAVRVETHIAPAVDGVIIDEPVVQEGLIVVPAAELGLCCSLTKAPFVTTTEVYPDSPKTTPDACNRAQRAAVCGALDYVLAHAA